MKEILTIEDRSKATDCIFKIPELNVDSNRNLVILMYNEIQRIKARLQEARQSVRLLEELLKQKEEEFRMLEPLVELEFSTTEKEWESQEVNTVISNSTDYRNTNI
jgi:NADH:ubiquinone oxidoreductase subunit D